MEGHSESNVSYFSIYPPTSMPGVQTASQGPLHDEATFRPDARATYPTSHSDNVPWTEVNPVNNHDPHDGMASEDVVPIAQLFANLSMVDYHQSIVGTLNQPHTLANDSTGPGQSTVSTSVPLHGIPAAADGHPFECGDCHKTFDRASRLDNCRNRHLGIKPWECGGRCQDPTCDARYTSVDYLRRHLLSDEERRGQCPKCHQNISKQNMARHKASCV